MNGRTAGLLFLSVVVLGLTGCGTTGSGGSSPKKTAAGASAGSGAVRGGGYYLDDGPHAVIPANLASVPSAVPRVEPFFAPSLRPYTVMGRRFVPQQQLKARKQRGHASWYGKRFHGNATSIGERYDMYAMTAAHPTLPLPSYARVTNVANGRSVVVRVNDRGPFLRDRIMDLSFVAAYQLGYVNAGSALVEVEPITHEQIRSRRVPKATPVVVAASPRPATTSVQATGATQSRPAVAVVQPQVAVAAPAPPPQAAVAAPAPLPWPVAVEEEYDVIALFGRDAEPEIAAEHWSTIARPRLPLSQALASGGAVFLQLGMFETRSNASDLLARAQTELDSPADRVHLFDEQGVFRLQIGPFSSIEVAREEAERIAHILQLQPFVVTR